jgi:hypothetical protein
MLSGGKKKGRKREREERREEREEKERERRKIEYEYSVGGTCGLEKMHVTRICLQQHSRRCDSAHDFCPYRAHFSGLYRDEHPRKTSLEAINHERTLTVPETLFHRESVPL